MANIISLIISYPYILALLNGEESDSADGTKKKSNDVICPDEGRIHLHIEVMEDDENIDKEVDIFI